LPLYGERVPEGRERGRRFGDLDIFITIPHNLQVSLEILSTDNDSTPTVIRVKAESFCILETSIKEEMYMMLSIVDKPERRYTSRFKTEIFHHTLWGCKAKFATRRQSLSLKRSL